MHKDGFEKSLYRAKNLCRIQKKTNHDRSTFAKESQLIKVFFPHLHYNVEKILECGKFF